MPPKQLTLQMIGYLDMRMKGSLPPGVDEAGAMQILNMQQEIRQVLQSQAEALQKPQAEPVAERNAQPPATTAEDYAAAMDKVRKPQEGK